HDTDAPRRRRLPPGEAGLRRRLAPLAARCCARGACACLVHSGARRSLAPLAIDARGTPVNEQQLAAVEARGEAFVSAGAGTGKTRVLVERFVRAVCDEGLDV